MCRPTATTSIPTTRWKTPGSSPGWTASRWTRERTGPSRTTSSTKRKPNRGWRTNGGNQPAPAQPAPAAPHGRDTPAPGRPRRPVSEEEDFQGFDAEINNRYEEIKRGSTHISELQAMTMPQLLKIARDEQLTDYTGLKKQ